MGGGGGCDLPLAVYSECAAALPPGTGLPGRSGGALGYKRGRSKVGRGAAPGGDVGFLVAGFWRGGGGRLGNLKGKCPALPHILTISLATLRRKSALHKVQSPPGTTRSQPRPVLTAQDTGVPPGTSTCRVPHDPPLGFSRLWPPPGDVFSRDVPGVCGEGVMGAAGPGPVARRPRLCPYLMMTHWFSASISMLRYMLSVRA